MAEDQLIDDSPAGVLSAIAASLEGLAGASDVEMVDLLDGLERLKGAAAARQAEVTAELDQIRADAAAAAGRNPADAGLGVEIGLARREAPQRGRCHLRLARALTRDLPHTLDLLRTGEISEHRAEIVATESTHLAAAQRRRLDERLAGVLPGLGNVETTQAVRRAVLRLDEAGYLERRSRALTGRRVTTRHLGDGMSAITAVLASETVAAITASLRRAAETRLATCESTGEVEDRTRGQVVADTAADRLTGTVFATGAPVAVKLLVSAETLLAEDGAECEPGLVPGCGHVPASVARSMVRHGLAHPTSSVRRVFCHDTGAPHTSPHLVAMESDTRLVTGPLRELVVDLRDQGTCRVPWCNAPAVHADHPTPARQGGETSFTNAQGLCAGCNYAKETTGFHATASLDDQARHAVEITTPTGHRHTSRPPDPPAPPAPRNNRRENQLAHLIETHLAVHVTDDYPQRN